MSVDKDGIMHDGRVDSPRDEFEALMAASSLGAPHVRARTEPIPADARHRLHEAAARHRPPAAQPAPDPRAPLRDGGLLPGPDRPGTARGAGAASDPIAIVGLGVVMPTRWNPDEFWRLLSTSSAQNEAVVVVDACGGQENVRGTTDLSPLRQCAEQLADLLSTARRRLEHDVTSLLTYGVYEPLDDVEAPAQCDVAKFLRHGDHWRARSGPSTLGEALRRATRAELSATRLADDHPLACPDEWTASDGLRSRTPWTAAFVRLQAARALGRVPGMTGRLTMGADALPLPLWLCSIQRPTTQTRPWLRTLLQPRTQPPVSVSEETALAYAGPIPLTRSLALAAGLRTAHSAEDRAGTPTLSCARMADLLHLAPARQQHSPMSGITRPHPLASLPAPSAGQDVGQPTSAALRETLPEPWPLTFWPHADAAPGRPGKRHLRALLDCAQILLAVEQAVDLDPAHRQAIPVQHPSPPDPDAYVPRPRSELLVPRGLSAATAERGHADGDTSPPVQALDQSGPRLSVEHTADATEHQAELWVRLHADENDPGDLLHTRLVYRTTAPYAVTAFFNTDTADEREWTFARELLAEGVDHSTGIGDVIVWPDETPHHAERPGRLYLRLRSPDGTALLSMDRSHVEAFLRATQRTADSHAAAEQLDSLHLWRNEWTELTCPNITE